MDAESAIEFKWTKYNLTNPPIDAPVLTIMVSDLELFLTDFFLLKYINFYYIFDKFVACFLCFFFLDVSKFYFYLFCFISVNTFSN